MCVSLKELTSQEIEIALPLSFVLLYTNCLSEGTSSMAGEGGWDEAGAAGFGEKRLKNTLPLYGNKDSMNINSMILTNIVGSPYFKEELINYKTFHEVVDEIYYKVEHLEPWEKNSRKLAGQVGMCAGVRGVAAGGIVSTAFCLLFKMFTLKLTRKQLTAMLNHRDSPYIRGIGFMYIRYCQPPADFWDWYSPYLDDEEEIDLKAGGGYSVPIGEMCRMMISKLDWFGTLFPRLPVNVQKDLEAKLKAVQMANRVEQMNNLVSNGQDAPAAGGEDMWGEAGRRVQEENRTSVRNSPNNRSRDVQRRSHSGERRRSRSRDQRPSIRDRDRSKEHRRFRDRSTDRRRDGSRDRRRSHSRERRDVRDRRRSRSMEKRRRSRSRSHSRSRRVHRSHSRNRRSRSRDRKGTDRSSRRRSHSRERRR